MSADAWSCHHSAAAGCVNFYPNAIAVSLRCGHSKPAGVWSYRRSASVAAVNSNRFAAADAEIPDRNGPAAFVIAGHSIPVDDAIRDRNAAGHDPVARHASAVAAVPAADGGRCARPSSADGVRPAAGASAALLVGGAVAVVVPVDATLAVAAVPGVAPAVAGLPIADAEVIVRAVPLPVG